MKRLPIWTWLLGIYLILFVGFLPGVGNNWDWIVPYFGSSYQAIIESLSSAWAPKGLGEPVSYASGAPYWFVFQLFLALGVPPEVVIYLVLVGLFSLGSYLVYLTWKDALGGRILGLIVGLAAMLNPAIFYKLLAGHLLYLVAFVAFLGLVYYLLRRYNDSLHSALTVGLIFALSGIQTQFFVFSALILIWFFILYRPRIRLIGLLAIVGLPILLHAFWLVNFISGSVSLETVSGAAKADSFSTLMRSSWKELVTLSFSPATFIRNFYSPPILVFSALLYPALFVGLASRRQLSRDQWFVLGMLVVSLVVASGTFHRVPIPYLQSLYPMLREVGHAAPLVTLFLLILVASIWSVFGVFRYLAKAYLTIFILISATIYMLHVPKVDYSKVRLLFDNFQQFNSFDNSTYRALTYPFFNQYSIRGTETKIRGGTPMSNSGWDNFTIFSGKDYIDNALSPSELKSSLQYQFLQDYNVKTLKPYNIRYIYDYSDIYQSNADRFMAAEAYNNDLSLIKNDPNFFQKIINKNPGDVRLVAPNILEIINFSPRISGEGVSFKKINETRYEIRIDNDQPVTSLQFLSNFHSGWKVYESDGSRFKCDAYSGNECVTNKKSLFTGDELGFFRKQPIAEESHEALTPVGNSWTITSNGNGQPRFITLYYRPQSWFVLGLIASSLTLLGTISYLLTTRKRLSKPSA